MSVEILSTAAQASGTTNPQQIEVVIIIFIIIIIISLIITVDKTQP